MFTRHRQLYRRALVLPHQIEAAAQGQQLNVFGMHFALIHAEFDLAQIQGAAGGAEHFGVFVFRRNQRRAAFR